MFDVAIAHELCIDSIVYCDMKNICTIFTIGWNNGVLDKNFFTLVDKNLNTYYTLDGKKASITNRKFKIEFFN